MKQFIAWSLIIYFGSHSALFALALDKEKLITLKPLCSERILAQAAEYDNNRLWGSLGSGLLGMGIITSNGGSNIDNNKLGNLSFGLLFLTASALMYFTPGEPVLQNNTLQALGLTGAEKEVAAYSLMKTNAVRTKEGRKSAGLTMTATGIGWALLASMASSATQSYKDSMNTGAVIFAAIGIMAYFNPSPAEREMDEIDKFVAAPTQP